MRPEPVRWVLKEWIFNGHVGLKMTGWKVCALIFHIELWGSSQVGWVINLIKTQTRVSVHVEFWCENMENIFLLPVRPCCRGRCPARFGSSRTAASWSLSPWRWPPWGWECLCTAPGRWRRVVRNVTEELFGNVTECLGMSETVRVWFWGLSGVWKRRIKVCEKENVKFCLQVRWGGELKTLSGRYQY